MSLLSSLNIGNSGLAASQLAINVTGQNISNANTEGYSRKQVNLSPSMRRDASFGQMGFGVDLTGINRIRDIFLDQQIALQKTEQGYYSELDDALSRIENIFIEPAEEGLNNILDNFWDSWQDLANNPADMSAREVVRSSARVLIDVLHSRSAELEQFRMTRDETLDQKVKTINGISQEIFNLNQEIAAVELNDKKKANDSRDRRDNLMQQLSKLIDVQFNEDDQGMITVTTGGNIIVGPTSVIKLEVVRLSVLDENFQQKSEITVRFENSKKVYNPTGGELKGVLDVRDKVVPQYEALLDELASTLVTNINEVHKTGYNMNRVSGVLFFDETGLDAKNISLSAAVEENATNISAASGGTSRGPFTVNPLGGVPASGSPILNLRNFDPQYRNIVSGSPIVTLTGNGQILEEGAGKDYVVDYANGAITFINYARYNPGDAVEITFRYNDYSYPGDGDGGTALAVSQFRNISVTGKDTLGNPTQSIGEFYSAFIGTLGIERNQAQSNLDTRIFLVDQLTSSQQALSGVSIDEEMANMIKFEHSYQASARFMSTVNSMLDVLMNI